MGNPFTIKPENLPRAMLTAFLLALCTLAAAIAWKPADHAFATPHVDKAEYDKKQAEQDAEIKATREAHHRLEASFAVTTANLADDIKDIKDGVNNINEFLRAPRYSQPVPQDLNSD